MKKIITLLCVGFILLYCFGCEMITPTGEQIPEDITSYNGTKIVKLTYTTIDYNGGYTKKKVLDFNENKYYSANYIPYEQTDELELKKTFTDDEEKIFIDLCYLNGLFSINDFYQQTGIIDGGGWKLLIEYVDGTSKLSRGDNAGPVNVFNKCSTCFYDLCDEEVMGTLPTYYTYPPNISYAFQYAEINSSVTTNEIAYVVKANYKWNKKEITNVNYYETNEEYKSKNKFIPEFNYKLILYTANYDYKEKFNKIIVKEYDYNTELSNEKIIYTGKWIKQIELDLNLNKIYVYELLFSNGDYVQYTFSTFYSN